MKRVTRAFIPQCSEDFLLAKTNRLAWNDVAAEGEGVVVCYDYRANRKTPLPEQLVAAIQALEQAR